MVEGESDIVWKLISRCASFHDVMIHCSGGNMRAGTSVLFYSFTTKNNLFSKSIFELDWQFVVRPLRCIGSQEPPGAPFVSDLRARPQRELTLTEIVSSNIKFFFILKV